MTRRNTNDLTFGDLLNEELLLLLTYRLLTQKECDQIKKFCMAGDEEIARMGLGIIIEKKKEYFTSRVLKLNDEIDADDFMNKKVWDELNTDLKDAQDKLEKIKEIGDKLKKQNYHRK